MSQNHRGLVERRPLIVGLGALVLSVWVLLACAYPGILWMSRFTFPAWLGLYAVYLADRPLRFRLLYEGLIATGAYWLLHDIPQALHLQLLMPHTAGQFQVLLVTTGALAALPFGRRGPGVAGFAGALLAGLWIIYAAERHGFVFNPMRDLDAHVLPAVIFMLLGGLMCERLTRRVRQDTSYAGPQPALWAFVLGAALTRIVALW